MYEELSIQRVIYEIRGHKVMLDSDLAQLYQVGTKVLNQAVKRNAERFPEDFMFQLTEREWLDLRSQIVTLNQDVRKYKPYAFTEHGILMLSSILKSDVATMINIKIMRIFIQMRQYVFGQVATSEQMIELRKLVLLYMEQTDTRIEQNDKQINDVISVLKGLIASPPEHKPIGFKVD